MSDDRLRLRPLRWSRAFGWLWTLIGVLFAVCGLMGPLAATITAILAGGAFAAVGYSLATACVWANSDALIYRYGRTRRVPASDIRAIDIGPGSGAMYPRVSLHVRRSDGSSLTLTALSRPATAAGRSLLSREAELLRHELALQQGSPKIGDRSQPLPGH